MATREQADKVLSNPAFKNAIADMSEEYVGNILAAKTPEETWVSRQKYDGLTMFVAELEAKLRER